MSYCPDASADVAISPICLHIVGSQLDFISTIVKHVLSAQLVALSACICALAVIITLGFYCAFQFR